MKEKRKEKSTQQNRKNSKLKTFENKENVSSIHE